MYHLAPPRLDYVVDTKSCTSTRANTVQRKKHSRRRWLRHRQLRWLGTNIYVGITSGRFYGGCRAAGSALYRDMSSFVRCGSPRTARCRQRVISRSGASSSAAQNWVKESHHGPVAKSAECRQRPQAARPAPRGSSPPLPMCRRRRTHTPAAAAAATQGGARRRVESVHSGPAAQLQRDVKM